MIQRVQSLYLLLNLICLIILAFGVELVSYSDADTIFSVSAIHVDSLELGTEIFRNSYMHFGAFILAILIISNLVTLMSFKNLKRQHRLGRNFFVTYLLLIISFLIWIYFGYGMLGDELEGTRKMGAGFIIFVIGLPFIFLANIGIKRDKNLLDSINRIR